MQPPSRARVADVASRNTTGHERAVLEKLAEVAPEVLHGADSLQTMHSFMAALALVLDDATFARVLLALSGNHPNACAHILGGDNGEVSGVGAKKASGDSGEVPHFKSALTYLDLPTQQGVGATKSPSKQGRPKTIHESLPQTGGSPKKAGTPNRSPMRKGLSPMKATSPNVNRGSAREGSPDEPKRGSPQPQEDAARRPNLLLPSTFT